MDYNKIGSFIAKQRKNKKLTQAKLAEQIFVSEKTVSKWENGNGIPDTNSLLLLCDVLDVDLNELLSGEKGAKEPDKNEQLLVSMVKELEDKNKIIYTSMWVIVSVCLIAFFGGCLIVKLLIPKGVWQIITIIGLTILFIMPCFYALKLEVIVGVYKCKRCGHEIIPTYTEALIAMHFGTTRHLKCPKCKKHTWCKKVITKKEEQ